MKIKSLSASSPESEDLAPVPRSFRSGLGERSAVLGLWSCDVVRLGLLREAGSDKRADLADWGRDFLLSWSPTSSMEAVPLDDWGACPTRAVATSWSESNTLVSPTWAS